MTQNATTDRPGPRTGTCAWGLRSAGSSLGESGKRQVKEFTGMWRLEPDTDLVAFAEVLAPGGWVNPPGESSSVMTTLLGLIPTARWFVARSQGFDGYTLFFSSQLEGSPEKYFADCALIGKDNLTAIWGNCVGCPSGPDVTARDIVEYIARGWIGTLICNEVAPRASPGDGVADGDRQDGADAGGQPGVRRDLAPDLRRGPGLRGHRARLAAEWVGENPWVPGYPPNGRTPVSTEPTESEPRPARCRATSFGVDPCSRQRANVTTPRARTSSGARARD